MDDPQSWLLNSFWGQVSLLGILLGIVVWVVYALLSERLFGRKTVERVAKERDDWKTAYFTESAAHLITQNSLRSATEALSTTDRLLKHLRELSSGGDG